MRGQKRDATDEHLRYFCTISTKRQSPRSGMWYDELEEENYQHKMIEKKKIQTKMGEYAKFPMQPG